MFAHLWGVSTSGFPLSPVVPTAFVFAPNHPLLMVSLFFPPCRVNFFPKNHGPSLMMCLCFRFFSLALPETQGVVTIEYSFVFPRNSCIFPGDRPPLVLFLDNWSQYIFGLFLRFSLSLQFHFLGDFPFTFSACSFRPTPPNTTRYEAIRPFECFCSFAPILAARFTFFSVVSLLLASSPPPPP